MDVLPEGITPETPRVLLLWCVAVLLTLHLWRCLWIRNTHRPPGPIAWPIIGNAAQLGNAPHIYFTRLAEKYGNVFQIKLGSRAVVVLNGDAIKEALIKRGMEFAGRPDFTSFKHVAGGDSMAFGVMTDSWKLHRKVAQSTVRMFSTGNVQTKRIFEGQILCELKELLSLFVRKTEAHQFFQPMFDLVVSTANVMSAVCFGKRYSYEDDEFRQVVGRNEQFTKTVGAGSVVDVMPWLQYFPNPIRTLFDSFKKLNLEFTSFIRDKVVEHRKTIKSITIRDMTDAFIVALEQIKDSVGVSPHKDFVTPVLGDIFGASQDTMSTAQQWIVLLFIKFPEIQLRLQQEVDKVVGRSRLPCINDQVQLPYVMAFFYEVMRFTSFLPLTIPHSTTMDTSIMGYTIPKNTVIFINQWSINCNTDMWTNPQTFDPERFLDQQGALNKDLAGKVLIFSLGKRRCIGEELSKLYLFLFTALIAHQCHITSDPARPPQLDYKYGLTLKPHPYFIAVSLRQDMTLLDEVVQREAEGEATPD
ncbi:cytochrome P450 1B1 [Thalassophryne amazonica]|uniref:cytochrome P450 1B1 n=1 Tax=Thalassophryne amazonica TaxID=390379 RepID=UPI001471A011|nr:cytochrome P450 1B1 [Thalassophryne amazonica]